MSGAELMLLGAGVGAMTDKQNPMRGAILGGAMGGVGAGMMGGAGAAGAATKGAATSGLLSPTGYGGTTFLTAAPEGAGFSGILNSISSSDNPLANRAIQSVLSPMGGGGGNQQIVQSGTGIEQGGMNQMEGDPVGQFLQAKGVKQPKRGLIAVQTDEDDDRYLRV